MTHRIRFDPIKVADQWRTVEKKGSLREKIGIYHPGGGGKNLSDSTTTNLGWVIRRHFRFAYAFVFSI